MGTRTCCKVTGSSSRSRGPRSCWRWQALLATGLTTAASFTTTPRQRWRGATRKTTAASSRCKRAATSGVCFRASAVGAKWDISNKQRIGLSEVQLVQKMIDGVTKIIEIEETLAANPGLTPMQALAKVGK